MFAPSGLRCLSSAAQKLNRTTDVAMWTRLRQLVLEGINTSLTFKDTLLTRNETIYAELRGHPNDFHEDKGEVGYSPLLWGLSYENIVPQVSTNSVM